LTLAALIDTSQWPAGSILQGIAKHRPLAVMAACSAIANLALSIALIHPLGLTGIALGTLIPTTVVCLGLAMPYSMHVIAVTKTQVVKEILLPVFLPAVPSAIVLSVLRDAIEPSSLLSIMVISVIGLLMYGIGYLTLGASEAERQTCRSFELR